MDTLVYDDKAEKVCNAGSCYNNIGKPVAAPISHDERIEPRHSNDHVGKCSVLSPNELQNFYRAIRPLLDGCGLTKVPCGMCPVSMKFFTLILSFMSLTLCVSIFYVMEPCLSWIYANFSISK